MKEIKDGPWECVLLKTGNKDDLEDSYALLEHFEGCFIKADGIICKLKNIKPSPSWSQISIGGGVQWFTLGNYFDIYLPLKH
jgi:hypothetical protein